MNDFSGKVALITGAGKGFGRVIAVAFAVHGARVAVNDITPINLNQTVAEIRANQGQVRDYVADVASKMAVQAMINQILDEWGQIDILVNCATVNPNVSILEMDEWDWRRTLDVNLTGTFFSMQSIGRVMRQQGGGVIVNVASIPENSQGAKGRAAYTASNMGLFGLTRASASEFAAYNIRINAIGLGIIEKGVNVNSLEDAESVQSWMANRNIEGSIETQEVAGMVLHLCSSSSRDISGKIFQIEKRGSYT
ncbi:MAG: SDR family oxidoreductase [Anaerolineales bacterium]|nr:SDR family oxidoreductase [Anaerolineales bacterium]